VNYVKVAKQLSTKYRYHVPLENVYPIFLTLHWVRFSVLMNWRSRYFQLASRRIAEFARSLGFSFRFVQESSELMLVFSFRWLPRNALQKGDAFALRKHWCVFFGSVQDIRNAVSEWVKEGGKSRE